MVGGSFTGLTVRTKVSVAVTWPSLTVSVIVVCPDWFAAGVKRTERFTPAPENEMPDCDTRDRFDDAPVIVREAKGVSMSDKVMLIAALCVSSLVTWLDTSEIPGASFTAFTVNE